MNKTKKAVLIAVACVSAVMGAWGLAACQTTPNTPAEPKHTHNYVNWTSDGDTTHTGTCDNTVGECDTKTKTESHDTTGTDGACSKCGYKAAGGIVEDNKITLGTDKTIASLTEEGTTLTFEGLEAGKEYTLSCTNDKVEFRVGILQGNPVTFEYGLATHDVTVHSTEGTLTDVVLKLEEAEEHGGGDENEYTTIEFDTDVTVTGADFFTPKYYQITLAETGEYQALSDGMPIASGRINIGTEVDGEGYVIAIYPDMNDAYTLEAGTYYIEVTENITFKIATSIGHVHTIDTTSWTGDSTGHWHPLLCYDAITAKSEVEEHDFGDWSEADEDGVKTKTCSVCEYKEMQVDGTAISGGRTESSASVVSAGVYNVTIKTAMVEGHLSVAEQYFKLVGGSTAKKYTVKLLTSNTTISPDISGVDSFSEVGGTFEVVLEEGDSVLFNVVSNDEDIQTGYTCNVAFKVTESAAPAAGDILRPIKAVEGANTKENTAGEKVYYAIRYTDFKSGVKITFSESDNVYALGMNIYGTEQPIESGFEIDESDYKGGTYYICASSSSTNCTIVVEKFVAQGSKDSPIEATIGADTPNQVKLDMMKDVLNQWFKLESATGGKFTLTASDGDAVLETYTTIPDRLSASFNGSNIVTVELEANVPLYICARHWNNMSYTFTVTEFVDGAQDGKSIATAFVITGSGEYTIPDEVMGSYDSSIYKYVATENCTVSVSYDETDGNRLFLVALTEDGEEDWSKSNSNPATFTLSAGQTFIIQIYPELAKSDKFTITIS
ncbi:MAG: hypothetical protein K2K39_00170 [Clostridia bacterium]|nr:hypothetical protein [Clostridia bacterium]